jgi:hypothetical protein
MEFGYRINRELKKVDPKIRCKQYVADGSWFKTVKQEGPKSFTGDIGDTCGAIMVILFENA